MPTGAIYNKATGLIQQTISPALTNADQLAGLDTAGLAQAIIPDGKNGGTGMINMATGQYKDFAPPGPPVPNLWVQLTAAMINKGLLSANDFHPVTVAEMNAALEPASMGTVSS